MAVEGIGQVVNVNVGGILYTTTLATLTKEEGSLLHSMLSTDEASPMTDSKGRIFIDRDGALFRYILDYLRNERLLLPDNFQEVNRLRQEAQYFRLGGLLAQLTEAGPRLGVDGWPASASALSGAGFLHKKRPSATDMSGAGGGEGYIVVGYRGTFAFGRDMSDVKFRKLSRILVCGKVKMCREVFKESLNESRDPDRGLDSDRYTARFFLKHTLLEQAFDQLCVAGFRMVGSCGSGTSAPSDLQDIKPGQFQVQIEDQWNHYNEFVFLRTSPGCSCPSMLCPPILPVSRTSLTPED